ncbi:MAG: hypothetical protein EOO44_11590 [Flavobacterium sp.]|nr:MAG: hypothetical protein EOO44_11590 [Flavobacterium sp.]
MKNYQNKSNFLILFGLLLSISNIYSQSVNNEISTYNWFDKTVGKENLDIINGTPHNNPYRTVGGTHIYFIDQYELGSLTYEGQVYYNVKLKYDIYRDILVLNPFESENIGINLIQNKVESFSIKDKNFIKIDKKINAVPQFTTGYYEENKIAPDFIFYIKYHKDQQKVIGEGIVSYTFKEDTFYFLNFKNSVNQISSKNDVIKIFPEQKKQINEFYFMNRELKKADLNQFMKNLMKYINNSLSIQTK